jgi:hypothetical protein
MPARDMAAYMRDYRARKRGEPVVDKAFRASADVSESEIAAIRAKVAAVGPSAVIAKTAGRLDVISSDAWEARRRAREASTMPQRAPSTPQPPSTPQAPARSMLAIGGRPGRGLVAQGRGMPARPDIAAVSPYTHAKEFEANATASINLLAREVTALKRRVGELEHERTEAVRIEPAWQKVLMAAAMGVNAYAAMCQAAEQDRAASARPRVKRAQTV